LKELESKKNFTAVKKANGIVELSYKVEMAEEAAVARAEHLRDWICSYNRQIEELGRLKKLAEDELAVIESIYLKEE